MTDSRIYLDNASTTRTDERVVKEMIPYMSRDFGNASSLHQFGTTGRATIEHSRKIIAEAIGTSASELFFTGSGTESNNWALKGVAGASKRKGNHIIVSSIEHDCILNTCTWLEKEGFEITCLPVDQEGVVDLDALQSSIGPKTILVSVMHANNKR